MELPPQEPLKVSFHDIKQPLNVIQLATGNIRARILPLLGPEDAEYLSGKLDRIESQIGRATGLLDDLAVELGVRAPRPD